MGIRHCDGLSFESITPNSKCELGRLEVFKVIASNASVNRDSGANCETPPIHLGRSVESSYIN
eukprot:4677253-Amphidinium_carterae.3